MTEAQWWDATDPDPLIEWLYFDTQGAERKLRLFVVACGYRILPLITELAEYAHYLEATERYLDGLIGFRDWRVAVGTLDRDHREWDENHYCEMWTNLPAFYARSAILEGTRTRFAEGYPQWPGRREKDPESRSVPQPRVASWDAELAVESTTADPADYERMFWDESNSPYGGERPSNPKTGERQSHVYILHDIFGPLPFRDVVIAPEWLTSDVLALARGIYNDKTFDQMPILADALQDAGCDNDDILNHCRAADWEHVRGCWVLDLLLGKPWREATAC